LNQEKLFFIIGIGRSGTTLLQSIMNTQWLITNGVMKISSVSQGTSESVEIPDWVKNNAGWWAEGLITDSEFVTGIEWLISKGVMKIGIL